MDKGQVKERGSKRLTLPFPADVFEISRENKKCEEHVFIKISTKRKSSNQFITNLF